MTKNVSTIGIKILKTREARGITRSKLAEDVGCNYRDVLRWETSIHEPKASTLKKIADVLNVGLDYLVTEDEFTEMLTKKDAPRYEKFTIHVFIEKNV